MCQSVDVSDSSRHMVSMDTAVMLMGSLATTSPRVELEACYLQLDVHAVDLEVGFLP